MIPSQRVVRVPANKYCFINREVLDGRELKPSDQLSAEQHAAVGTTVVAAVESDNNDRAVE